MTALATLIVLLVVRVLIISLHRVAPIRLTEDPEKELLIIRVYRALLLI